MTEAADPAVLAQLASATIHTVAIRARAQVPRKDLEAIVKGAIDMMLRLEHRWYDEKHSRALGRI